MAAMNARQLAALGQNALAWSKAYVALKEALVKEGVTPDEAERVARDSVNIAGLWREDSGEPCPLCGRGV
jgi:hypothetical protein